VRCKEEYKGIVYIYLQYLGEFLTTTVVNYVEQEYAQTSYHYLLQTVLIILF
jgi:hypothetical protein